MKVKGRGSSLLAGRFLNLVIVKNSAAESRAHCVQNSAAVKVKYPARGGTAGQSGNIRYGPTLRDSVTKVRLSLCMPLRCIGGVVVWVTKS